MAAVFAEEPVDPILGKSPVAITDPKKRAAIRTPDPILGNKPVAITSPPVVERHVHERRHPRSENCRYGKGADGLLHSNCPKPDRVFVPLGVRYLPSYGISPFESDVNYVIDGVPVVLTNIWRGTCHHNDCSVATGYMATDPNRGVFVLSDPFYSPGPSLFFAPVANGPVVVTKEDSFNNLLVMQTIAGDYPIAASGSVAQGAMVRTKGGSVFYFNYFKDRIVEQQ